METAELELLIEDSKSDPESFGRLYDSFYPRIFSYVARRIPNTSDAEDVTGHVFEKVLRGINGFDPRRASFETWLYKITNNAIVDFYRKESNRCVTSIDHADIAYCFESTPGLDYYTRYLKILELINRLPPSHQEVLSLRLIEDMSNEEIARLLGCSSRYAAVRISRALNRLRKLAIEEGVLEELD